MIYGLTVRWSLEGARTGVEQEFCDYVREVSHEKFSGYAGLHQKYWAVVPGDHVEGVYLWSSERARTQWILELATNPSPVNAIFGREPVLIEEFDVVAVAEGGDGMPKPGRW
ncbi:hypothetical protein BH20ACT5_BH20ACT5_16870 [soil metagenome]